MKYNGELPLWWQNQMKSFAHNNSFFHSKWPLGKQNIVLPRDNRILSLTHDSQSEPQVIYNPITAMGFLAMFTF